MARTRKKMKDIRNVLNCKKIDSDTSIRFISKATGVSRPTVKDYLDLSIQSGLTLEELLELNDAELGTELGIQPKDLQETEANTNLKEWLRKNLNQLTKKHMTKKLLHEIYLQEESQGLPPCCW